jgi:uncharacterized repeat protein (TIGR02543 family)
MSKGQLAIGGDMIKKQIYRSAPTFYLLIALCSLFLFSCDNPYYVFILEPKTVTFYTNGGSSVADQTLFKGQPVQRPSDPSKDIHTFGAWYTDNITFNEPWNFNTIPTTDMTLYARWIPIHTVTVTFDNNGGDTEADPKVISVVYNGLITPPATEPTKVGYGFYAWYRDAEGITKWDFETDRVTQDITLYARWIRNYLSVTLSVEQIINPSFPLPDNITISRTGNGFYITAVVSVTASDFDAGSINWTVTGVGNYSGQTFTTAGATITLDAEDVRYNSVGTHILILEVGIDGIIYRRNIVFTIVN